MRDLHSGGSATYDARSGQGRECAPDAAGVGRNAGQAVYCGKKLVGHAGDRTTESLLENKVAFPTRPASLARGKG